MRGERSGELVRRGRFGQRGDHVGEASDAGDPVLDRVGAAVGRWRRGEQGAHLLEQRRARFGGAVLVAVTVGEEEPAAGKRQADGEEVALLGFGVAARVEPELFALRLGEERVAAAVAARELAVLEGADEDVVEAGGAQTVGAGDPHPALDRAAPDAEVERGDGLGEAFRGGGERAERGEVRERRGDRPGGAQLEPVAGAEARAVLGGSEGARGHRRGEPGDGGAERGRGFGGGVAEALEVTRVLADAALLLRRRSLVAIPCGCVRTFQRYPRVTANALAVLVDMRARVPSPPGQRRLGVGDALTADRPLEPVDPAGEKPEGPRR